MDTDNIIKEMTEYLINFVEKPNDLFGNLPVCPFAKKARTNAKLEFFVHPLKDVQILKYKAEEFASNAMHGLWLINPTKELSVESVETIASELQQMGYVDLSFFSGHPLSEFKVAEVYTRREPYPNILVQKNSILEQKEKLLVKTRYYDKVIEYFPEVLPFMEE